MYCMSKIAPVIAVIPISFLLALSFFVLLSVDKAKTKRLKSFGYLVAVILWLAILAIVSAGAYKFTKGRDSSKCMMQKEMMRGMPGMHPEQMPEMTKTK